MSLRENNMIFFKEEGFDFLLFILSLLIFVVSFSWQGPKPWEGD